MNCSQQDLTCTKLKTDCILSKGLVDLFLWTLHFRQGQYSSQSRPIWIKSKDLSSLTLELNFSFWGGGWKMTPRASKFCWKMNEFRLSAVRQRHLADERYYYWDREYTSLSSVHLPTEFWRPWWRLPRSTSKCKIGFRGLTAETFWFDPNWSTLWRVLTLAEMECSQKKTDKPLKTSLAPKGTTVATLEETDIPWGAAIWSVISGFCVKKTTFRSFSLGLWQYLCLLT